MQTPTIPTFATFLSSQPATPEPETLAPLAEGSAAYNYVRLFYGKGVRGFAAHEGGGGVSGERFPLYKPAWFVDTQRTTKRRPTA